MTMIMMIMMIVMIMITMIMMMMAKIMLNEVSVDLEIFSRIIILFVLKIASDAGQALKSDVLVMHGPKDQKLNYYNQGRQF